MPALNETHDPGLRSWVESANVAGADFPIQNLPFGVFRRPGEHARGGVAIGDQILDLRLGVASGLFEDEALRAAQATGSEDLTPLLALGQGPASALRRRLCELLRETGPGRATGEALARRLLTPMANAELLAPARVRQFSDMCVSTFHIGRFHGNDERGQPITPPVFRTLPVGYDGRASSVVVSGTPVRRPNGTWVAEGETDPRFGPEPRQDYELEVAIWFGGQGNALGDPIPIGDAGRSIFGYGLLNDWSARGIQMWETMLGPFLGKSLATTISPWIVTTEALAPFRAPSFARPAGDPPVPEHLWSHEDQAEGGIAIGLEALVSSARMTSDGVSPRQICRTDFRQTYWTPAQILAHHTSNGCAFAAGDLLGSGTCSGPSQEAAACLWEKLLGGPWTLPNGEARTWLEDGDTVILRGRAEREGYVGIGFGEATGTILPAHNFGRAVPAMPATAPAPP
jgi:fumarylacetoacetase